MEYLGRVVNIPKLHDSFDITIAENMNDINEILDCLKSTPFMNMLVTLFLYNQ